MGAMYSHAVKRDRSSAELNKCSHAERDARIVNDTHQLPR